MNRTDAAQSCWLDNTMAARAAQVCQKQYEVLPPRGAKPDLRSDGRREWTVLSGLLLFVDSGESSRHKHAFQDSSARLHLIALATGVKCSPFDKTSPNGDLLHDCHAEILTRRLARRWFLHRLCREVQANRKSAGAPAELSGDSDPAAIDDLPRIFEPVADSQPRWRLRPEVQLVWYISTLPCGDASTAQLLSSRLERFPEQAASFAPIHTPAMHAEAVARGRAHQSVLSTLRTKPGRADCLPALSHSCSDKLARYVALGLQGALLSSLVEPIVPAAFVIGFSPQDEAKHSIQDQAEILHRECVRALRDRLATAAPYMSKVDALRVVLLPDNFVHSKEAVGHLARVGQRPGQSWDDIEPVPAAGSVTWTRVNGSKGSVENVVAGLKKGASSSRKKGEEHLPLHVSRRSTLCKLNWFSDFLKAKRELLLISEQSYGSPYFSAKHDYKEPNIRVYQNRKLHLRGWAPNEENWNEDAEQRAFRHAYERRAVRAFIANDGSSAIQDGLVGTAAASQPGALLPQPSSSSLREPDVRAPFFGWLVTGAAGESFDPSGSLVSSDLHNPKVNP